MKFISKRLSTLFKKLFIPTAAILVFGVLMSVVLFEATKITVDVTQNGETETISTHSETVGDLIDNLEVVVDEADELSHGLNESLENGMTINYKQAKNIVLEIDDEHLNYATTADTVGEFLQEKDLSFSDRDDVSFKASDMIEDELVLSVTKAYQVVINDGGEKIKVWTTGDSIENLLNEHSIKLTKKDKVKPSLSKEADKETSIKITRVQKDKDIVEESVAYKTEKRNDSSLPKGEEKIISNGKKGKLVKEYELTLENGKETDRELVKEEIQEDSQNKVIAVGTKEPEPEPDLVTLADKQPKAKAEQPKEQPKKESQSSPEQKTASANDKVEDKNPEKNSEPDGEVLYMNATAYSADCNGCSGITATGINLKADRNKKVVAVDPSVIPLGSTVWVEGYGTAIAGDTGGAITGNRIDLHVSSHSEAMGFGRKTVKVKILK